MGWQSVVISSRWALRWGIKYVWLFYCGALRYWLFNTRDRPCFHVAARHNLTKPIFTSWSKIQFWLYTCIGLWGSRLPVFLNLLTPDSIGFAEFQHQTGPTGNSRFRMTTTVMGQFLDVACICREVLLNPVEIHWIDFTKISWTHWHIYFVATYSYCNGNALVSGRHGTCKLLALIARSEEMPWTNQTKSATKSRSWANYNHCTGRPSHKPFYTSGNHPQHGLESFGSVSFVQWRVIRHRQTLMPTENTCRKIMGWDTL